MTTAAPGRIRRSVRFAQLAQESAAPRTAPLRRERMTVADHLEYPSFERKQDWTVGMGISPSGRFQVRDAADPRPRIFSREGLRGDWARRILFVTASAAAAVLLALLAVLGSCQARSRRLEDQIAAASRKQEELRLSLEAAGGDIRVLTKAVELNLISSGGAPSIWLTAPAAATMVLVDAGESSSTERPEMRASAGSGE